MCDPVDVFSLVLIFGIFVRMTWWLFSTCSGSVGGSVDIAPAVAEEEVEEEDFPEPKVDVTHIHVTTLDEVVSVSFESQNPRNKLQ